MVEGLTTSASDPGSEDDVAIVTSEISHTTCRSRDLATSRRPRSNRSSAWTQPITIQQQDAGDASGEAIPVPIPNTEVKLSSAEDTERAAFRENRSSPGFLRFRDMALAGPSPTAALAARGPAAGILEPMTTPVEAPAAPARAPEASPADVDADGPAIADICPYLL